MNHLDELLSVYLDGETSPAEARLVNQHTASCRRCRSRLEDLHAARSAIRGLPMLELPPALISDIGSGLEAPGRSHRAVWFGAAAAIAAGFIAVSALLASPPPSLDFADVSRQLGARVSLDSGVSSVNFVLPQGGDPE